MTQKQLFYKVSENIGRANEFFCQLVREGLTQKELKNLIDRNPNVWSKYSHFLKILPDLKIN